MAKNVHAFTGATPWNHNGKVDKSGPSRELKHNGTRPNVVPATPMSHFQSTPLSGDGHKALKNKSTMMGAPYAKSSDRSEMPTNGMGTPAGVKKSKPEVAKDPTKWHRKYSLDSKI